MKRIFVPLLTLAMLAPWPTSVAGEELLDGVAAQVNGSIVLVSEVMRSVGAREAAMRQAGAPLSEIAKLRADGLEVLIEARLIEELVKANELEADDEEIDATIETIAQENGLTLEQLYASVVYHGMSVDDYRNQIKQDFERRTVINRVVGPRIAVEEREVRALYRQRFGDQPEGGETVHVRQILRAYGGPSGREKDLACDQAREARRRVGAGEPFEEVAAQVSEVAPRDGGDIGWLPLDSAATWMQEALEGLEPGDTSGVIVLPFGCSILQLVERRAYEPVTFERAQEMLTGEIWERKTEAEYRSWMEELRATSYIERKGYFADAARFGEATFPMPGEDGASDGS